MWTANARKYNFLTLSDWNDFVRNREIILAKTQKIVEVLCQDSFWRFIYQGFLACGIFYYDVGLNIKCCGKNPHPNVYNFLQSSTLLCTFLSTNFLALSNIPSVSENMVYSTKLLIVETYR